MTFCADSTEGRICDCSPATDGKMLDLTKETVFITGGHGFLGRHVVRKLREMGCDVIAPTHEQCDLLNWRDDDFGNSLPWGIGASQPVVIHLAATCGGIGDNQARPADMALENMAMALNLIWNSEKRIKKLVCVGSVCAYPENTPCPFKEEDLHNGYPEPTNAPYGIAKRATWTLLDAYHRQYGLKCAYLIPANLYGPGDNFDLETSHVIPAMIRKFVEASETGGMLTLWGDGTPTRDFLYVEDAADAVIRAAECVDTPEPINVGTGIETSMDKLAYKVDFTVDLEASLEGKRWQWDNTKPNGQQRRVLDTTRAKERMGWEAKTGLMDGLRATVDWYRSTYRPVEIDPLLTSKAGIEG